MSFILDALKKSETERQRGDAPALYETKMAPPRRTVAPWLIVLAALLVINIIVLTVVALGGQSLGRTLLGAVGGYVLWTFSEYWIHRAIFHFEPEAGFGARLHWMVHGVHHDHPNDPLRLVMPPAVSVPLAVLFLAAFVAVFGTPLAWAIGAGFLAGYLVYDMLHFALHHHRQPRTALERRLRELHMRHHFEDETHGYGISAPWWDIVFGTFGQRNRLS